MDGIDATDTLVYKGMLDNEVFPPNLNFTLFRRHRVERRGGGVLIAVKNTPISHDVNIELTWICISSPSSKLILGICYRALIRSVITFANH